MHTIIAWEALKMPEWKTQGRNCRSGKRETGKRAGERILYG